MLNKTKLRFFVINLTPPILYPIILKLVTVITNFSSQGSVQNLIYSPRWQKIKSGIGKDISLFIDTSSNCPALDMIEGTYDGYFFRELLEFDPAGKIIFDVGSHIGFDALLFAKQVGRKGRVVGFEPNPFNRKRFELNVSKNTALKKRIRIENLALADSVGSADFLMTNTVDGWTSSGSFLDSAHTALQHDSYEKDLGFKKVKVKLSTIDTFVKSSKLKPDFIKIDVEGAEYQVLLGAVVTLKKIKPVLFIEVHSIYCALSVGSFLEKFRYTYKVLHEERDGRCFIIATDISK